MKKPSKKTLDIIIIILLGVFAVLAIQYGLNAIRFNYEPSNHTHQLIGVLLLTCAAIFFKKVKEIPKYKEQANLWEWFMLTLVPTPLVFSAVIQSGISWYWGLFGFVLASTIWISIGVYNGTREKKWNSDYKFNFGIAVFMLFMIGLMIHLLFTLIAIDQPEKLMPWMELETE